MTLTRHAEQYSGRGVGRRQGLFHSAPHRFTATPWEGVTTPARLL